MQLLKPTQFGNPILRASASLLDTEAMLSQEIKQLIADMYFTLTSKKLGVGLAAPQVGVPIALAVINIQKTPLRPKVEPFELTIINPVITRVFGRKVQEWEGCISGGPGKASLFAKIPRYKKIELRYFDEHGKEHTRIFEGLQAHVIQHEVDHLNGILFVDKVKDTKTFMTYSEYRKARRQKLLD